MPACVIIGTTCSVTCSSSSLIWRSPFSISARRQEICWLSLITSSVSRITSRCCSEFTWEHVMDRIDDNSNGSSPHQLIRGIQFNSPQPTCLWSRVSPALPPCHTCQGTCPGPCPQCPGIPDCQYTCYHIQTPESRSSCPETRVPAPPPWSLRPPQCHPQRQWCREQEEISINMIYINIKINELLQCVLELCTGGIVSRWAEHPHHQIFDTSSVYLYNLDNFSLT